MIFDEVSEREKLALDLRGEGMSYREVGEHLGVCANRAREIILNVRKRQSKRAIPRLEPEQIAATPVEFLAELMREQRLPARPYGT